MDHPTVSIILPQRPPCWYDLPGLWADASLKLKLRTTLPPFISLALMLTLWPLGLLVSGLVLATCAVGGAMRMLFQPFRAEQPTTLIAWRLPLAGAIAAGCVYLFVYSLDLLRVDLRDTMRGLQEQVITHGEVTDSPCGEAMRCAIPVGKYPMSMHLGSWLTRHDEYVRDSPPPVYMAGYKLAPDISVLFMLDGEGTLTGRYLGDVYWADIDLDTLENGPSQHY